MRSTRTASIMLCNFLLLLLICTKPFLILSESIHTHEGTSELQSLSEESTPETRTLKYATCNICASGQKISKPFQYVSFQGQKIQCIKLSASGQLGLIRPSICKLIPYSGIRQTCGCKWAYDPLLRGTIRHKDKFMVIKIPIENSWIIVYLTHYRIDLIWSAKMEGKEEGKNDLFDLVRKI